MSYSRPSIIGMYKGGAFDFSFAINANYPHDPPKVKCTQTVILRVLHSLSSRDTNRRFHDETQIYHPNVDLEGNVCLNILREDWKPVLNLNSVMVGLQYLFLEPNADDPLNKGMRCHFSDVYRLQLTLPFSEAAEELRKNRENFLQNVKSSMRGGNVKGVQYARVLVQ
jgi:ubiquitin-conjugating enzyme E2 M